MKTHAPQCKITLVKAQKRTEIVPGLPIAQDRYQGLEAIDLTPFLLTEGASLNIAKSVREPAGAFSISIPDQPRSAGKTGFVETVYALVEPMDYIEIRLAHNPEDYAGKKKLGIVMRGFVSQVSRSESMQGGRPARSVTISGQDMGKIWQIMQIYFINNMVLGEFNLSPLAYFHRWADETQAKHMPASEYVQSVLTGVINPFLKELASLEKPPENMEAISAWTKKCSLTGEISPYTIASFQDVSVYGMMAKLLDVGPFNELYTQDEEEGVYLVARPIPYKNLKDGQYIQPGANAEILAISSADIESLSVSRSDASVANSYWVSSEQWDIPNNVSQKELANQYGEAGDFLLNEYLNTHQKYYGWRKMEVSALLGPPDYLASDGNKQSGQNEQVTALGNFLAEKRHLLAEMNKDAVVFEQGQISMKGNEKLKAGTFLKITRGMGKIEIMECYAHTIAHEFTPLTGLFRTVAQFDRGTGWVVRAKSKTPLYRTEVDMGGALGKGK